MTVRHLNVSKLRLNKRGTLVLFNQFAEAISNITNQQAVLHSQANNDSINSIHDTDKNKVKFKGKQISGSNLKAVRNGDILKGSSIQYVRKIFRKTNISDPLIRSRTCAYQWVRNVSFSEKFAYVSNR